MFNLVKFGSAQKLLTIVATTVSTHKTDIATGVGIGLGIGSIFVAFKEGTKAERLIREEKEYRLREAGEDPDDFRLEAIDNYPLAWSDRIKITWKNYLLPVGMGLGAVALILLARKSDKTASTALAAAYAMSESNLKDLQDAVDKTIGENKKKKDEFKQNLAEVKNENHPVKPDEIYGTNTPETPEYFMDGNTGERFWSTREKVDRAIIAFNKELHNTMDCGVDYNYFRSLLGHNDPCMTSFGDMVGYNPMNGEKEIEYTAFIVPEGEPYAGHSCLLFNDVGAAPCTDFR